MNITIIGTGNMARGIGTRALAGGNNLTLVGHHPGKAEDLAVELQGVTTGGASVQAAAAGAALDGEVIILAVPYPAIAPVVAQYGDQLAGKIVVDITNPIDFATMSPTVAPDSSGAEEIAKIAPAGTKDRESLQYDLRGLAGGRTGGGAAARRPDRRRRCGR